MPDFQNVSSMNPWRCRLGHVINAAGGVRPRGCFYDDNVTDSSEAWEKASTESYAVHLMKAVGAVTEGLEDYFYHYCPNDGTEACPNMIDRDEDKVRDKFEYIKQVTITERLAENMKGNECVFRENGNGNVGFQVYSIEQRQVGPDNTKYKYDYSPITTLPADRAEIDDIRVPPVTFYDKEGQRTTDLTSDYAGCRPIVSSTTASTTDKDPGGVVIGLIATLVAVVVIVLLIAATYFIRKSKLFTRHVCLCYASFRVKL